MATKRRSKHFCSLTLIRFACTVKMSCRYSLTRQFNWTTVLVTVYKCNLWTKSMSHLLCTPYGLYLAKNEKKEYHSLIIICESSRLKPSYGLHPVSFNSLSKSVSLTSLFSTVFIQKVVFLLQAEGNWEQKCDCWKGR